MCVFGKDRPFEPGASPGCARLIPASARRLLSTEVPIRTIPGMAAADCGQAETPIPPHIPVRSVGNGATYVYGRNVKAGRYRAEWGSRSAISRARPGLGHFIRFTVGPAQEGLPPGAGPPGTPLVGVRPAQPGTPPPGLEPVEPAALPLGLALSDRSTLPSGRRELLYRNQRGLAILLTQEPAEGTRQRVAGGSPETVVVGDTEVLWLRWPRTDAVAQLRWERRGVLFQVIVLEAPTGGCLWRRPASWSRC